jgi:hypothetical protein
MSNNTPGSALGINFHPKPDQMGDNPPQDHPRDSNSTHFSAL